MKKYGLLIFFLLILSCSACSNSPEDLPDPNALTNAANSSELVNSDTNTILPAGI